MCPRLCPACPCFMLCDRGSCCLVPDSPPSPGSSSGRHLTPASVTATLPALVTSPGFDRPPTVAGHAHSDRWARRHPPWPASAQRVLRVVSPAQRGGAFVQRRPPLLFSASATLRFCRRASAGRPSGPRPCSSDAFPRLSRGTLCPVWLPNGARWSCLDPGWFLAGVRACARTPGPVCSPVSASLGPAARSVTEVCARQLWSTHWLSGSQGKARDSCLCAFAEPSPGTFRREDQLRPDGSECVQCMSAE